MKMQLTKKELQVILTALVQSNGVFEKGWLPPGLNPTDAYHIGNRVIEKIMHRLSPDHARAVGGVAERDIL